MKSIGQLGRILGVAVVSSVLVFGSLSSVSAARDEALYQQCLDKRAGYLNELGTYVNIDSGSGYEEGLKTFQGMLIERLQALGAEVEYQEVISRRQAT